MHTQKTNINNAYNKKMFITILSVFVFFVSFFALSNTSKAVGSCDAEYDQKMSKWPELKNQWEQEWRGCLTRSCPTPPGSSKTRKCNQSAQCQTYCTEAGTSTGGLLNCCQGGPKIKPHVPNPCKDRLDGKCNPKRKKLNGRKGKKSGKPKQGKQKPPQLPKLPKGGGKKKSPPKQQTPKKDLKTCNPLKKTFDAGECTDAVKNTLSDLLKKDNGKENNHENTKNTTGVEADNSSTLKNIADLKDKSLQNNIINPTAPILEENSTNAHDDKKALAPTTDNNNTTNDYPITKVTPTDTHNDNITPTTINTENSANDTTSEMNKHGTAEPAPLFPTNVRGFEVSKSIPTVDLSGFSNIKDSINTSKISETLGGIKDWLSGIMKRLF